MGVAQIIQIMDDRDLVLKPMVTWGSSKISRASPYF